jgi:hypothetical protein
VLVRVLDAHDTTIIATIKNTGHKALLLNFIL